jgi:type 1 fimbria pilin
LYTAPVGSPVSAWGRAQGSNVRCGQFGSDKQSGHIGELYLSMAARVNTYTESGVVYDVFPTNVAGIGYAIGFQQRGSRSTTASGVCSATTYAAQAGVAPAAALPVTTNEPCTAIQGRSNAVSAGSANGGSGSDINFSYTVNIRFIKTASAIGSGTIARTFGDTCYREYLSASFNPVPPFTTIQASSRCFNQIYANGSGTVVPAGPTCAFPSGLDRNVPLPDAPVLSLASAGGTGVTRNFSIDIDCDKATRLQYTFQGTTDGIPSVLKLAAGSTAAGVGVQLLDAAGNPISIGTVYEVSGDVNAPVNLVFGVRYYKISTFVTPGTLSAVTSLTVTYQ